MAEVVKTIKACHIEDGMRIRFDHGAYTLEGDVKVVEDYGGSLVDMTFERDGNEASILITRTADVDVLRMPAPKEPKNLGAIITVKYRRSDTKRTLVKVRDDTWYMSSSAWQVDQSWSDILERCYDIKVVHEGYDPDHERVKIPESWDDLKDVPKFVRYLVDRDGDQLRRDEIDPDSWHWGDGGMFTWEAYELSHYSPFSIDPEHPLTSEGQE